jgi:hypothetical protein
MRGVYDLINNYIDGYSRRKPDRDNFLERYLDSFYGEMAISKTRLELKKAQTIKSLKGEKSAK